MKTKHVKAPKAKTTATAYAPSHWTREAAAKLKATATNTIPPFNLAKLKTLMPGWHFWDWWYVMNERNQVANVGGYTVVVGLARPVDDAKSANARMVFSYSEDGVHYTAGSVKNACSMTVRNGAVPPCCVTTANCRRSIPSRRALS